MIESPRYRRRKGGRLSRRLVTVLLVVDVVVLVALLVWLLRLLPQTNVPAQPPAGKDGYVTSFGGKAGKLRNPLAVAVDETGTVYVSEADAGVVDAFSAEGRFLRSYSLPKRQDGTKAYPASLAVLQDSRIAVVDLASSRVWVVSTAPASRGKVLGWVGSKGGAPKHPTAVAATPRGVVVGDSDEHTLKEYDPSGRLLRDLGGRLRPPLTFVGGIASSAGTLYVSDSNAGRVLELRPSTDAARVLPAHFSLPRGLCLTRDALVVADAFSGVVSSYPLAGGEQGRLELPGAVKWDPAGVAWSAATDRFFVADTSAGLVHVFDGSALR
jgi:DNA-binding beta-propeller fold protein YncE